MDALLWLIFAFLCGLVTAYDPSISNGTCYYGPNKQADGNFIPCGNAAGGVQTCCQARDICLSSNACFNGQYYVTYLAGCTDGTYQDSKCPDKGDFADQQWVGLVRCFVSNGTGEEWGPCQEPSQPKINQGNQHCSCDATSSTAVFTDAAVLTDIASLPVSIGNAIAWESGFQPSTTIMDRTPTNSRTTSTAATTGSSNTPVPGTNTGAFITPSSTANPSSSSNLSTAAKAGIGVGTAGCALAIGAVLVFLLWYRRRKSRTVPPIQDQIRPSSLGPWSMGSADLTDKGEAASSNHNYNHRSWGGELPTEANEVTTAKTTLGEGAIRTTPNTPATLYQPYQRSPNVAASEIDGSPAASTSRLAPSGSTHEKPVYERPIYEMPA